MKKYIGFLLLIIAFNLSARANDVKTGKDFIQINLNSLSKQFHQTQFSGFEYIKLNNIKNTVPVQKEQFLFDEIHLIIAIPDDCEIHIEKIFSSKKLLSNRVNFVRDFKESAKIQKTGKQRGVSSAIIAINPFEFDEYTNSLFVYDLIDIKVKFDRQIPLSEFDYNLPELRFFTEYLNKQHIPELLNRAEKRQNLSAEIKNPKENFQNISWYNPEQEYVKLLTKNDGIARVTAQDLLKTATTFAGKETKYFHLIYKGEEVSIRFIKDTDGYFNNDDEIIFLGHRGAGDTTWFNHYDDFSAYFFYYDESSEGIRFDDFPVVDNIANTLDYVYINEHIEFEKVYLHGDFKLQWDIETIHREGWLWKVLDSEKNNKFKYDFIINPKDSIEIFFNLMSVYWNNALIKKHDLSFTLNKDTLTKFSIDTGNILKFRQQISGEKFISGENSISFINHPQFETINDANKNIIIPNATGIDFIEIKGKTKPLATNGKSSFSIEAQNENFNLPIPNFRTKDILLLDESNQYLSVTEGKSGTSIIAGTKSGSQPWTSIVVNDSLYSSESNSMCIAILKAPDYSKIEFKCFTELNNKVVEFLNTATTGSIIAITYNSDFNPTAGIISKLQTLGSSAIAKVKSGDTWTFIVKTDDISGAEEIHSPSGPANITRFIEHNLGKSFLIDKKLQSNLNYKIHAYDKNALETADIREVNQSDLRNPENKADAIYITHKKFKAGADSLANYRRSQGHEIEVIDIDDVYKEFNYGIKSAHAIKSFLQFAYNNWQKPAPQFLLLIGDANWSGSRARNSANIDYIPSYGWPVSDYWYTCLDSGKDYLHEMFVGRIPASENQHVLNVLNKLREYETAPKMPWMKRFLSLTGGGGDGEKEIFKENMDGILSAHWINTDLAGDTMVVAKKGSATVGVAEANEIISKIDAGAVWVNFYGHGAPNVFDMDGWHADKLNNKGKYSFFTTISCNTAAFAEDTLVARNEEYLTIANKGFIGTSGSTNLGVDIPGMLIVTNMLKIVTNTNVVQRSLGEIVDNAKIPMMGYDPMTRAFAQQFVLLGDPMTNIRISPKRDIYLLDNEVKVTNVLGNTILIETDSIAKLTGFVYNNGFCEQNQLTLRMVHTFEDNPDTFMIQYPNLCTKETFLFDSLDILNKPGIHFIEIFADLLDTTLNIFTGDFEVFKSGLLALEPLPYWNVDRENLHFRFINPVTDNEVEYEFYISQLNSNNDEEVLLHSKSSEIQVLENCIDWLPETTLTYGNNYFLYARYTNPIKELESNWLRIPFYTHMQESEKVKINFNNYFLNELYLNNLKIVNENGINKIMFDDYNKSFNLTSAKGNDSVDRYSEIVYDNEIYVYTPSTSNAPVGINMIVVSGKDGQYKHTRRYNTWDGENSTRDLVNFLNDSVETGDWVLLVSCGGAWRMFYQTGLKNPDAIGGFKTFKEAMARFGAKQVNEIPEINNIPTVSYAFAGRKDLSNNNIYENISFDGSEIIIYDSLTIYPDKGVLSLPAIFSAKEWYDCKIDAEIDYSQMSSTFTFYGFSYSNSFQILNDFRDSISVDLGFMNTQKFPGIGMVLEVRRFSETSDLSLSNIEINFAPSPELAIIKSKSSFLKDTVMRGEKAEFNYYIENLSLRSNAEDIRMLYTLQPEGTTEIIELDTIVKILPNQKVSQSINIETLQLSENNSFKVNCNYFNLFKELYTFNNSMQSNLYLQRDNEKPFIKIKADGVEIRDSAYVAMSPYFEIELYDYSYEPVLSVPEPIRVRINSIRQTESNTKDYRLDLVNKDEFKAVLSFKADTLVDWDNRLEVIFRDAAGNIDTVEYHIFTSLNAILTNPQCEPNPVNESAKFTFNYRASDNQGTVNIMIFDITGRKITSLKSDLFIGNNEIYWDGYDSWGNSLSQGIYLFLIESNSQFFTEPVTGKFVKIK